MIISHLDLKKYNSKIHIPSLFPTPFANVCKHFHAVRSNYRFLIIHTYMFDSTHLSHDLIDIIHPIQNREWIPSSQPKSVVTHDWKNEARAEVNHCDGKTGKSPLILASGVGADNVCQLLLDSKALVDAEKLFVTLAGWWGFEGWEDIPPSSPKKRGSILIGVRLFLSLSRIWGNVTSQNSSFSSWDFFVASFPCGCQSSVWIQSGDRWNAKHGKWNMVGCNMTLAHSSYVITEPIQYVLCLHTSCRGAIHAYVWGRDNEYLVKGYWGKLGEKREAGCVQRIPSKNL